MQWWKQQRRTRKQQLVKTHNRSQIQEKFDQKCNMHQNSLSNYENVPILLGERTDCCILAAQYESVTTWGTVSDPTPVCLQHY